MTEGKYKVMREEYKDKADELALWKSLKKGYDYFNTSKKLPSIGFLDNGQYNVIKND